MEIANEFGFSLSGDLGKYLGVPLQHKKVSKGFFSLVTNKVIRKLSAWKANNLSLASRLTLCSSVLNAVPSYAMQFAFLPSSICSEFDSINRKFL